MKSMGATTTEDKKTVLDLFSGTEGFSKAFKESEKYEVVSVDIEEKFEPDIVANVLELDSEDLPDADIILASPPCDSFSMGSIGHHWHKHTEEVRLPDSQTAFTGVKLVYKTLWLINEINPDYWFMENPRAGLRKVLGMPQGTVTWCQYWTDRDKRERGSPVMKPTDLWGEHPEELEYKSCSNGASCHESAPRGSQTGTQGKENAEIRASIPYGLSEAIMEAIE